MSDFEYIRTAITKDGESFRIRPAQNEDAEQITNNIRAVCAEKIYLATDSFIITPEWNRAFSNSTDEVGGYLLAVAELQNRIAGHLRLFPPWYGSRGRHVGDVTTTLIAPWRGRGIGKALLGYALEWASYAKFHKLNTSIFATNQRALTLFLSYNFVQEGYRPAQFLVENQLSVTKTGWYQGVPPTQAGWLGVTSHTIHDGVGCGGRNGNLPSRRFHSQRAKPVTFLRLLSSNACPTVPCDL